MKWFLPVLFISYMAGITLFTHSHVVNGVTIVHSHPFERAADGTYHHVESCIGDRQRINTYIRGRCFISIMYPVYPPAS